MTKEERIHVSEAAGTKTIRYFSFRYPFIHKEVLVFGGNCGCCGKWNWQWCQKGWEWTGPCEECIKGLLDEATELVKKNTRVLPSGSLKGG